MNSVCLEGLCYAVPQEPPKSFGKLIASRRLCRLILSEPNLPLLLLLNGFNEAICSHLGFVLIVEAKSGARVLLKPGEKREGLTLYAYPPLEKPRLEYIGPLPSTIGIQDLLLYNDRVNIVVDIDIPLGDGTMLRCRPRLGCSKVRANHSRLESGGRASIKVFKPTMLVPAFLSSWRTRISRKVSAKLPWLCIKGDTSQLLGICLEEKCGYSLDPTGEILVENGEVLITRGCSMQVAYKEFFLANLYKRLVAEGLRIEVNSPLLFISGGALPLTSTIDEEGGRIEVKLHLWNPSPAPRNIEIYFPCYRVAEAKQYSYTLLGYEKLYAEYNVVRLVLQPHELVFMDTVLKSLPPLLRRKC